MKIKSDVEEWLKSQCNRHANGYCDTLRCLARGGYVRGSGGFDYNIATCEVHEILQVLNLEKPE